MIDIYRPRRGHNYKCLYWKKDTNQVNNEVLVHNSQPTGLFYAKIYSSKATEKQNFAMAFRISTQGLTIETEDIIALEEDDIVKFDGEIWLVGKVMTEPVQKNAEFGRRTSVKTLIELKKGE